MQICGTFTVIQFWCHNQTMNGPLWLVSYITKKTYIFRENKSQLIVKCATDGVTYNHSIRLIV